VIDQQKTVKEITNKVFLGDSREVLKEFPDKCVDTCITSPPYWGLRDYGTSTWVGGDENCSHRRDTKKSDKCITGHKNFDEMLGVGDAIYKSECKRCGAKRVDSQIGLEEEVSDYIEQLVNVFGEVHRILKDDGTLWLNLGDSYAGSTGKSGGVSEIQSVKRQVDTGSIGSLRPAKVAGLKNKDLIGIPWRAALALQKYGWYLRQDIIWHKPNPMPESVNDRCTKSHEYMFLLSKNPQYYYDADSIKEPTVTPNTGTSWEQRKLDGEPMRHGLQGAAAVGAGNFKTYEKRNKRSVWTVEDSEHKNLKEKGQSVQSMHVNRAEGKGEPVHYGKRNKRSVWTVSTKAYKGAHFATFPPELITPCIKAGSREGGIVLDPFMGSGTIAEYSKRLGRLYTGVELSEEYHALIKQRTSQMEMFI